MMSEEPPCLRLLIDQMNPSRYQSKLETCQILDYLNKSPVRPGNVLVEEHRA